MAGEARVRPLLGGFESWRERGFPVEPLRVGPHGPGSATVWAREEKAMPEGPRISVQEAREEVTSKRALLGCRYENEEKWKKIKLEGAMSFGGVQATLPSLTKDQGFFFYWPCPAEATAAGQAAKYQAQGFSNVKALKGGVEAWMGAGYPMATT